MSVPGNLYTPTIRKTRGGDYLIEQSLLGDGTSSYLNRTPSVAGNRKTFTFSCWFKTAVGAGTKGLFGAGVTAADRCYIYVAGSGNGTFGIIAVTGGVIDINLQTSAKLFDPSAWYHLTVAVDTTQATSSDRVKMYINGVQMTDLTASTYPSQNADIQLNTTSLSHALGRGYDGGGTPFYSNSLMALPILVDGAALDPTSFGELDDDGYWNPIEYAGNAATVKWTDNLSIDDHATKSDTGTGTASSEVGAGAAAEHAFNEITSGPTHTGWQSSSTGSSWLQFEFNSAQTIKQYTIVGHVAAWSIANRAPNSWTILASNTGSFSGEEVTIDTVSGESGWTDQEVRYYDCSDNDTAYTYYRFDISSNNGGTLDSIIEWNMFGQTSTTAGYGENGFLLDFSDTSNFGDDTSGNGNDYTPNNFTAADQLSDTPTDSADDEIGNFATMNPLKNNGFTISEGNLQLDITGADTQYGIASTSAFDPSDTEGFYAEVDYSASNLNNQNWCAGVMDTELYDLNNTGFSSTSNVLWLFLDGSVKRNQNSQSSYGSNLSDNDTVRFAIKDGKIWAGDSSGWFASGDPVAGTNAMYTNVTADYVNFCSWHNGNFTTSFGWNFGQKAFAYTPPTGFKTLATQEFPAPTIADGSDYFNPVLYEGNGSTQSITGVGFNLSTDGGLVWIKNRDAADPHILQDTVRGTGTFLRSNTTDADTATSTAVTSFDSDGFTLGTGNAVNTNAESYVAWCWKAGGTAVSNTDGSITSSVSANPTAGFSIVTYTGTGSTATVGHGLGKVPASVLVKRRDSTSNWVMLRPDLGAGYHLYLDLTNGVDTNPARFTTTNPTSTVFSINTNGDTNASSGTYVAYCWAEIEGFSKFGSYTGNGSADGPFIYTGFRPAFLLIRNTGVDNWIILDTARDTYNPANTDLYPNLTNGESTASAVDILSNGFKPKDGNTVSNANGGTYIYMAFAEVPFQGDDGYTQARAR